MSKQEKGVEKNSVMPAISLTLGIISIISALFWYVSLPSGIIALIFGIKSYKKEGSKLSLAGLITGIVGLALFTLIYISLIIILLLNNA